MTEDRRISEFTEITSLNDTDFIPLVRISNPNLNERNLIIKVLNFIKQATSLQFGTIKLAGDLEGTAEEPRVVGLATKAPINSPNFTGTPTIASTPTAESNSKHIVNVEYVTQEITPMLSDMLPIYLDSNIAEKSYLILNNISYDFKINSVSVSSSTGTCKVTFIKNSTAFTNATELSVTPTMSTYTFTGGLTLEVMDKFYISFTNVDEAQDVNLTLNYTRL